MAHRGAGRDMSAQTTRSMATAARAGVRRTLWLAGAGLLAPWGCKPSFDIAPAEVPSLRGGNRVGIHLVPEGWEAEVQPNEPGQLWVGDPVAHTIALEDRERLSSAVEAGLAPFGMGLLASEGRLPPQQPPYAAPPALWFRNDEGRLVEIPVDSIKRVHVWDPSLTAGEIAAIVCGTLAGVGLIAGVTGTVASIVNGTVTMD
jgi:hypothetical protein